MIQTGSIKARVMIGLAAVMLIATACSTAAPGGSAGAKSYTIGFSNPGGVGNGWREAMLCSAKAQAVRRATSRRSRSSIATPTRPASFPTSGL